MFISVEGVLYTKEMKTILRFPPSKRTTYFKIPQSVTTIGGEAFMNCSELISLEIPESVIKIEGYAFEEVSNIKEIHIKTEHIEQLVVESHFPYSVTRDCILYVPIGTGYAYRHHPIWGEFKHVEIEKKKC